MHVWWRSKEMGVWYRKCQGQGGWCGQVNQEGFLQEVELQLGLMD